MKKYVRIAFFWLVGAIIGITLARAVISNYRFQKEMTEMHENIDELNRKFAIMELSELRGRVKEIEYIYFSSASITDELQEALISELEEIRLYDVYFREFDIFISKPITTSNIGDICEEIISQIDNEIHTIIMFGGEDV